MTSYELRISDLSSDVCSSDLRPAVTRERQPCHRTAFEQQHQRVTQRIRIAGPGISGQRTQATADFGLVFADDLMAGVLFFTQFDGGVTERTTTGIGTTGFRHRRFEYRFDLATRIRSEENTSELQTL